MPQLPTAPVNVARISVATSGTDFTAPEADFAALIQAAGFCPGRSSWDSAWSALGTFEKCQPVSKMSGYPVPGKPEVAGRRPKWRD